MVAQESVAFSKFCHRIYLGLGEMHVHDVPHILLESDSSSALQLLVGQDIPKRSGHIEIRMEWLKAKVAANELILEHRAGTDNVADLFTKCLPTKAFFFLADAVAKRYRPWPKGLRADSLPWFDSPLV